MFIWKKKPNIYSILKNLQKLHLKIIDKKI